MNRSVQWKFRPSILGFLLNPFYIARSSLYLAIKDCSMALSGNLLDVGCGTMPYRQLFGVERYTGLDIDCEYCRKLNFADYFYNGIDFPFSSEEFDSILCNQVLEHVFNPTVFLQEVHRVLKPGGKLLLTMPFVWDEHEQPYDYGRYTSFGLNSLLEDAGFRILRHEKLVAGAGVLFQLTNAYLYKITLKMPRVLRLFIRCTLMAGINIMGLCAQKLLPSNPDLYLDHCVLAIKND